MCQRYMLIVLGKIVKSALQRFEALVKYDVHFSLRFLSTSIPFVVKPKGGCDLQKYHKRAYYGVWSFFVFFFIVQPKAGCDLLKCHGPTRPPVNPLIKLSIWLRFVETFFRNESILGKLVKLQRNFIANTEKKKSVDKNENSDPPNLIMNHPRSFNFHS